MKRKGYRQCTPRNRDPGMKAEPWIDFTSGYVQRASEHMPKQGSKAPWKLYQNYVRDLMLLRFGRIDDGVMEFGSPGYAVDGRVKQAAG